MGELNAWASRLIDRGEKVKDVTAVTTGRRPELDGLRGVAVLLVIVAHSLSGVDPFNERGLAPWLHSGGGLVGVQLFFVLSGFLITGILVNEHERSGTVDLMRFYSRRVRRLLPALVVVCAATVVWVQVTTPDLSRHAFGSVLRALMYVGNLGEHQPFHEYGPWLGHTWSLAVEEQFYLVWPVVLLVALRVGRRAVGAVATGVLVVTVLWRFTASPETAYGLLRWDALAAGCLLALRPLEVRRLVVPAAVVVAWLTVTYGSGIDQWDYLLATGASVVLIAGAAHLPMKGRVLRHLGTVSYGLYLWHSMLLAFGVPVLAALPVSVLASELSWRLVERRFLDPRRAVVGNIAVEAATDSESLIHKSVPLRCLPLREHEIPVIG